MSIPEQQLLVRAGEALSVVVDRVEDDQWDRPADTGMSRGTVRDLVVGHIRDAEWVGHILAGRSIEEGKREFDGRTYDGDLKATWREVIGRAGTAALALEDPDKVVHLSFGDYTARDYLQQIIAYHGLQAWDLARVLGTDTTAALPDDLARCLLEMLTPVAEQWREFGVFGPAVPVPEDASARDRLLGLTGRQPD